jgi:hypothetical protein
VVSGSFHKITAPAEAASISGGNIATHRIARLQVFRTNAKNFVPRPSPDEPPAGPENTRRRDMML